jgi:hypothetical protein
MPHDCLEKAREIRRRTNVVLGLDAHDVVSELCREWGTENADDFYRYMKGLSDDELRSNVEAALERVRRRKLAKKAAEVTVYG